jgi:hypothetical protein
MTKTNKEKEDASKKKAASKQSTAQQQDLFHKHFIPAHASKNASTNASNYVSNNASNNATASATMIVQMEEEKDDTEEEEQLELNPKPMSTGDARSNGDGSGGEDDDDNNNDKNIHDMSAPLDDAPPGNDDPESMFDELKPAGPMKRYLQSLFKHLKYETRNDFPVTSHKWLLEFLSENDWQILTIKVHSLCCNLGIDFDEPSYYQDIVVWLPDLDLQF